MARILAYSAHGAGHVFPLIPILDELAARGHHIAVRTLSAHVPLMQSVLHAGTFSALRRSRDSRDLSLKPKAESRPTLRTARLG